MQLRLVSLRVVFRKIGLEFCLIQSSERQASQKINPVFTSYLNRPFQTLKGQFNTHVYHMIDLPGLREDSHMMSHVRQLSNHTDIPWSSKECLTLVSVVWTTSVFFLLDCLRGTLVPTTYTCLPLYNLKCVRQTWMYFALGWNCFTMCTSPIV